MLKANLTIGGAIYKPAAILENLKYFKGKAVVLNSEKEINKTIISEDLKKKSVILIRYESPKRGLRISKMYKSMKYLEGIRLANSCLNKWKIFRIK